MKSDAVRFFEKSPVFFAVIGKVETGSGKVNVA
jgi:hypothetical protein